MAIETMMVVKSTVETVAMKSFMPVHSAATREKLNPHSYYIGSIRLRGERLRSASASGIKGLMRSALRQGRSPPCPDCRARALNACMQALSSNEVGNTSQAQKKSTAREPIAPAQEYTAVNGPARRGGGTS